MRATIIAKPGDIRVENVPDPEIVQPTDAILGIVATCVCGSDLRDYRGINPVDEPHPIGHEYLGVVEEVGGEVASFKPGQFVIGSFFASDNTCPNCHAGYHTSCLHREFVGGAQAEYLRVPLADGTLVALPEEPHEEQVASLLACSDVMGTGWYAAVAAEVNPGVTVAVVGDGAVVTERGEEGITRIRELTEGVGADSVLECVGTAESMRQALRSTRPGGNVAFVGVPHDVQIDGQELFYSHVALRGGPAPVRAFLRELIDHVLAGRINPGKVFDLTLPLDEAAEAYRAMDERRAIKVLLRP